MRQLWKWALLIAGLALAAAACGGGAATPDENGEIVITMDEFNFSPSSIELTPGQTVTLVLVNEGAKEHEFMVGNEVNMEPGYANGFNTDFFENVHADVMPMDALFGMEEMDMGDDSMDMDDEHADDEHADDEHADEGMDMGDDSMDDMAEDGHEGHHGFMVVREAGEEARITFTVPEGLTGEWQIGCFEEDGAHWDDGMKGKLTIKTSA